MWQPASSPSGSGQWPPVRRMLPPQDVEPPGEALYQASASEAAEIPIPAAATAGALSGHEQLHFPIEALDPQAPAGVSTGLALPEASVNASVFSAASRWASRPSADPGLLGPAPTMLPATALAARRQEEAVPMAAGRARRTTDTAIMLAGGPGVSPLDYRAPSSAADYFAMRTNALPKGGPQPAGCGAASSSQGYPASPSNVPSGSRGGRRHASGTGALAKATGDDYLQAFITPRPGLAVAAATTTRRGGYGQRVANAPGHAPLPAGSGATAASSSSSRGSPSAPRLSGRGGGSTGEQWLHQQRLPRSAWHVIGDSVASWVPAEGEERPEVPELLQPLVEEVHQELGDQVALEDIQELARSGLLEQIPRNTNNEWSSIGSIGHSTGTCTPCNYWFKGICRHGILCKFCHFYHTGQKSKRLRPSKKTRVRIRRQEALKAQEDQGAAEDMPFLHL